MKVSESFQWSGMGCLMRHQWLYKLTKRCYRHNRVTWADKIIKEQSLRVPQSSRNCGFFFTLFTIT
jgi:hypothetical protein